MSSVVGDDGAGRQKAIEVDYPSNKNSKSEPTRRPREDKNIQKVTSGKVVQRQKGLASRIRETFTGDDAKSVGTYILFDVVIPAAKNMISEAGSQFIERMLFGDVRDRHRSTSRTNYTTYSRSTPRSSYNRPPTPRPGRDISYRARATHDFDEVVLESRGEAEEVLDRLHDLLRDYDMASVADLYDLVGVTSSFTDDRWGWMDLSGSSISRVREGYLLNLPRPVSID